MSKNLSITFVLPGACTAPVGGAKVVYEYANHLSRRGHRVTVIHPASLSIDMPFRAKSRSALAYLYRRVTGLYRPTRWFRVDSPVRLLWVPSLSQRYVPDGDVVIATAWQTAEWVASYPSSKGRRCYLIQDYEHYMAGSTEIRERIARTYHLGMTHMAVAPVIADLLASLGASRPTVIENGLDVQKCRVVVALTAAERNLIGFPMRLETFKRTEDAVAALAIVRTKLGHVKSWSFGGPRPDWMPDWVDYYERPTDEQLVDLYNRSAVFITPSQWEGWGLPGSEAMACGAALVSTDHGGVRAYAVHGQSALLSPARDVKSLANNICLLLADPPKRVAMAKRGVQSIQRFTWPTAISKFEEFLLHTRAC